jgi:hypothetical protein
LDTILNSWRSLSTNENQPETSPQNWRDSEPTWNPGARISWTWAC